MKKHFFLPLFYFSVVFLAVFDSWALYRLTFSNFNPSTLEIVRWWGIWLACYLLGYRFFKKINNKYTPQSLFRFSVALAIMANWAVWRNWVQRQSFDYDVNASLMMALYYNMAMCYLLSMQSSICKQFVLPQHESYYKKVVVTIAVIMAWCYAHFWSQMRLVDSYAISTIIYCAFWIYLTGNAFLANRSKDGDIEQKTIKEPRRSVQTRQKAVNLSDIMQNYSLLPTTITTALIASLLLFASSKGYFLDLFKFLDSATPGLMFVVLILMSSVKKIPPPAPANPLEEYIQKQKK